MMDSWNFAEEEKSMKLFKTIDERIRECGFRKVKEDANGALYENDDECIKHIVRVTEKSILNYIDNRKEAGIEAKGVKEAEVKLFLKKMKKIRLNNWVKSHEW